jgi:hypothetical protein
MNDIIPIIRTRFSVKSAKWPGFIPDAEWLNFRAKLFKRTALLSMRRQTQQDFVWFIEASPETYDFVSELVKSLNLPNTYPLLSDGDADGEGYMKLNDVDKARVPNADYYMLIRLDSDDMMHPDTIKTFCTRASLEYPIVGVNKGYKFNWSSGEVAIHYYNNSSCFGMLKQGKNLVFGNYGHKTIRHHFNSINLIDIPFVQICHGSNVRVGFSDSDIKLSKVEKKHFVEKYGVDWDKNLLRPEGDSNPQVVLRDWLQNGNRTNWFKLGIRKIIGVFK